MKLLLIFISFSAFSNTDGCSSLSLNTSSLKYNCIKSSDGSIDALKGSFRVGDKVAAWGPSKDASWYKIYSNAYKVYEILGFIEAPSQGKEGAVELIEIRNGYPLGEVKVFDWNRLAPLKCYQRITPQEHHFYSYDDPSDKKLNCGNLVESKVQKSSIFTETHIDAGYVQWMTYDNKHVGVFTLDKKLNYPRKQTKPFVLLDEQKKEKVFNAETSKSLEKFVESIECREHSICVGDEVRLRSTGAPYKVEFLTPRRLCIKKRSESSSSDCHIVTKDEVLMTVR